MSKLFKSLFVCRTLTFKEFVSSGLWLLSTIIKSIFISVSERYMNNECIIIFGDTAYIQGSQKEIYTIFYELAVPFYGNNLHYQWQQLQSKASSFYQEEIHAFLHRWKKLFVKDADYLKNDYVFSNTAVYFCEMFTHLTCI
jgi:hypothetical protein